MTDRCLRVAIFQGHKDEQNSLFLTKLYAGFESVTSLFNGECSLRTLSNLDNLHVVRGLRDRTSERLLFETAMTGPHHYFGFLDPRKHYILRIISNSDNLYYVVAEPSRLVVNPYEQLPQVPSIFTVALQPHKDFVWSAHNLQTDTNASLFARPGTFQFLRHHEHFDIPTVHEPQAFDWSSFRARLVAPNQPFAFDQKSVEMFKAAQHKLRLVTYFYGNEYFERFCVPHGTDFIEQHEFVQFIHALDANCGGFIVLGRFASNGELQLVKFQIPFGHTLLLDARCIHGDARLTGLYLMGMTGNHEAMQTADTVFFRDVHLDPTQPEQKKSDFEPLMTHDTCDSQQLLQRYRRLLGHISQNVNRERPLSAFFWQPSIVDTLNAFKNTKKYADWVKWQQKAGETNSLRCVASCAFV